MYRSHWLRPSLFLIAIVLAFALRANAGVYIEAGTSLGTRSDASSKSSGFLGSMSLYAPLTSEKRFLHFELGLQNRLISASPLSAGSSVISGRLDFRRFYVGAGYGPLTYVSKPGGEITSLHINSGASSLLFEGGLIWRVIPELQIVAAYSRESVTASTAGTSAATINEYGLRFRFPLSPGDSVRAASGVDFDGFRYPFGFMK